MSETFTDFIESVRNKTDIFDIISSYVALKRRGNKYIGLCPFHQEKTPSFTVDTDKGLFYCFGCQTGGDKISFIEKIENLPFKEAVTFLGEKYGIALPDDNKSEWQQQREQKSKKIYQLNKLSAEYFKACLHKTAFGQKVFSYFKARGIGEDIIEQFDLGAALTGGDSLYKALLKKDIAPDVMLDAKLVRKRDDGTFYDFFRSRAMIPIKNARGEVVGFGGRALGDDNPKYLNTAESEWFNKRKILYGLDVALGSIKRTSTAIIVEGYMDAIALHAGGFKNAVATLGTAFSEDHARILSQRAKEVIFCYDNDQAGIKAAVRAISIARAENINVRALSVPEGKDPDGYIRIKGKEAFHELLQSAKDGFSFQKDFVLKEKSFSTLAGKVEAVENILPFISELKNSIEAQSAVSALAGDLVIDESTIKSELSKYMAKHGKREVLPQKILSPLRHKSAGILAEAEKQLLWVLLKDHSFLAEMDEVFTKTGFFDHSAGKIFDALKKQGSEGITREEVMSSLDDKGRAMLVELLGIDMPEDDMEKVVADCLFQVKKAYLQKQKDECSIRASEYARLGDSRYAQALEQMRDLQNEINKLY